MKLTPKQRLFVDEYLKSGNATQAAIKAGYSDKTAQRMGSENLSKPVIKAYINAKMAEIESKKIAKADEVMQFYTRVLRKEETETQVVSSPIGAEQIEVQPNIKDRIQAAREIMKRYPKADPAMAEQIRKLQAEADMARWKADQVMGKNDDGDKTILLDDIEVDSDDQD